MNKKTISFLKYVLLLSAALFFLVGCDSATANEPKLDIDELDGEINPPDDIDVPEHEEFEDEEENENNNILLDGSFRGYIIGERWEGYSNVGELKFPAYFVFSENGNVKMYEKPFDNEDWTLVQDFNITQGRIATSDESIDDIIDWSDILKLPLITNADSLNAQFCVTLYPDGAQVGAISPFNMVLCTQDLWQIQIEFLNHTYHLTLTY